LKTELLVKIPMFKCQVKTPHLYPLPSGERVRVRGGLEFDIGILTFEGREVDECYLD